MKILLTFLFILSVLYSSSLNEDSYKQILSLFKNKEYELCYNEFYKLQKLNTDNPSIYFYLGRCSFELKKYSKAIDAYQNLIKLEPKSNRAKLELARSYFKNKNYKQSKKIFLLLLENDLPKKVKLNIEQYLIAIQKVESKNILNGLFVFGLNYDSNIYNSSDDEEFYIPQYSYINNGIFRNSTTNISDWAHQEIGILNYIKDIDIDKKIKNNIIFFAKTYQDYSDKNIVLLSYMPSIVVNYTKKLNIQYGIFYDSMWYGSNKYLTSYGIYPKLFYKYSNDILIKSHLKYQVKSHKQQIDLQKDSKIYEINIGILKTISNNLSLNYSFAFLNKKKKGGNLTNIDYHSDAFSINLNYSYSNKLSFMPKFIYKEKSYKDTDVLYHIKQKDTEYKYTISAKYLLQTNWLVQGVITYNENKSNIDSYQYDKQQLTINFVKSF